MYYEHQAWPSWRYGPNGESKVCESEADVPKGWVDHPNKLVDDGSPAGAKTANHAVEKQRTPLAEARIAFKAKFGKSPSPRATLEDLQAKLADDGPQHDL